MTETLILLDKLNVGVSYFNPRRSHFYVKFDDIRNGLKPLKGLDVDFELVSGSISLLGWVSPFRQYESLLQRKNIGTVYERMDEFGERTHEWDRTGKTWRRHIFCGSFKLTSFEQMTLEEKRLFKEIISQCSKKLRTKCAR